MIKKLFGLVALALLACTIPTPDSSANKKVAETQPDTVVTVPQFGKMVHKGEELKEALTELNSKL